MYSVLYTLGVLHQRALVKYRSFLEELEANGTALTTVTASPDGLTMQSSMGLDQIHASLAVARRVENPGIEYQDVLGVLTGANARTGRFEITEDETNLKFSGAAVGAARERLVGLTIGGHYLATLARETTQEISGEAKVKFTLVSVAPAPVADAP